MTMHYAIIEQERRLKLGSNGSFHVAALCSNGDGNAELTRVADAVDCTACCRILEEKPFYLMEATTSAWTLHARVVLHDDRPSYLVWKAEDVWQITPAGKAPENDAGYRELDALLALKGLYHHDLVLVDPSAAPARTFR